MAAVSSQLPTDVKWWQEEYGFFGEFYLEGDNSVEGYLINKKQNLAERTVEEVNGIINVLGWKDQPATGKTVIDLPCGYGRHSIGLAKRGYTVTGVDINSVHLGRATERAKNENVTGVTFVKQSMTDISYDNQFDAAINMFYSFGFFDTDEENDKVLANFYKALKPGGKFLMHTDVNIPRVISGKYREDETRNLTTGKELRIIDKYDTQTKRIEGVWIIKNAEGKEIRRDYSVRVYTKEEFTDMCYKAGFTKVEVFGDWDRRPYGDDEEDMMVVATK